MPSRRIIKGRSQIDMGLEKVKTWAWRSEVYGFGFRGLGVRVWGLGIQRCRVWGFRGLGFRGFGV